jgi:hypothetical protein
MEVGNFTSQVFGKIGGIKSFDTPRTPGAAAPPKLVGVDHTQEKQFTTVFLYFIFLRESRRFPDVGTHQCHSGYAPI